MRGNSILRTLLLGAALMAAVGCESISFSARGGAERIDIDPQTNRQGPPPWAPAHGYRRKTSYRYYYDQQIYYNVDNRMWTWLEQGNWRVGVRLPATLGVGLGPSVRVDLDGDQPWVYHPQVARAYPVRADKPWPASRRRSAKAGY